ncbi:MAG: DnaD domain-containing protein [Anaerolineae bacterium]
MKTFPGFPAGKVAHTPLPNLFFTELLPLIDDLAELKVTLHIFWRLYHLKDYPRCVSHEQLAGDTTLLRSLNELGRPVLDTLNDGLEQAVARGTLIKLVTTERKAARKQGNQAAQNDNPATQSSSHPATQPSSHPAIQPSSPAIFYFANTAQGRRAVDRIRAGKLALPEAGLQPAEVPVELERPNIFVLYERNIGVMTPFIADQLRDAEQTYPAEWIEDAFHRAAEQNVRKWVYVRGILKRWATEGRDDGTDRQVSQEDPERYISGQYADYVEH